MLFTGHRPQREQTVQKCVKEETRKVYSLIESLTEKDIRELKLILGVPITIIEKTKGDKTDFIFALRDEWEGFSGDRFYEALNDIGRTDLAEIFKRISWSTKESVQKKEITVRSLVHILSDEVELSDLKCIVWAELGQSYDPDLNRITALIQIIESGSIKPDLIYLCELMESVKRKDLAKRLKEYLVVFEKITEKELNKKLKKEMKHIQTQSQKKILH